MKDAYPRLCGGIFLVLLLQARKPRTRVNPDVLTEQTDGRSQTDILRELIRLLHSSFIEPAGASFKSNVSQYKSCLITKGEYLPFHNQLHVSDFDERVKCKYKEVLDEFAEFVNQFIDVQEQGTWLVKALLELIEQDKSISEEAHFYIDSSGESNAKETLRDRTTFDLEPFLLGVWHYIVVNVPNNAKGRSTYEEWHKKPELKGGSWIFASDIGQNLDRQIYVNRYFSQPKFSKPSEVVSSKDSEKIKQSIHRYLLKLETEY